VTLTAQNAANQQTINSLTASKKRLETINVDIAAKKKEIADKRAFHDEFIGSFKKYSGELIDKNKEIEQNAEELKASSIAEAKIIQNKILAEKQKLSVNVNQIAVVNKEITNFTSSKAVTQHNIALKTDDKVKKAKHLKKKAEVEDKLKTYPSVIQAFSNTGIPNIIIQNVLDDLQIEANNLLSQLKPGLQLSFVIEKTVEKTGDQTDTLDINYTVNGKKRYYEQLSGAMQMSIAFSLKLGLSSVLQKMLNVSIDFLLLDEVDHSFDKVSDDCFTDIVKFLSKELTVCVVTHDEKLKDKFSNYILVSQDANMVSTARVVSSW
jgi:DNA repair exonuclease SbcCD ATPase subunit